MKNQTALTGLWIMKIQGRKFVSHVEHAFIASYFTSPDSGREQSLCVFLNSRGLFLSGYIGGEKISNNV